MTAVLPRATALPARAAKPNPPKTHTRSRATSAETLRNACKAEVFDYTSPIPPGGKRERQSKERPQLLTRAGHDLDVAVSAFQKAIRRSHVDDACYWAAELLGRYDAYLWRRIKVILSEDIGIAEPVLPAVIDALHRTWQDQRKEKGGNGTLPTMHAVILLARAKKSRLVNHALIHHTGGDPRELYRDAPDYALDKHTKRGRELGRGIAHFLEEAALLADPETGELTAEGAIPDPYLEKRKALGADR